MRGMTGAAWAAVMAFGCLGAGAERAEAFVVSATATVSQADGDALNFGYMVGQSITLNIVPGVVYNSSTDADGKTSVDFLALDPFQFDIVGGTANLTYDNYSFDLLALISGVRSFSSVEIEAKRPSQKDINNGVLYTNGVTGTANSI